MRRKIFEEKKLEEKKLEEKCVTNLKEAIQFQKEGWKVLEVKSATNDKPKTWVLRKG